MANLPKLFISYSHQENIADILAYLTKVLEKDNNESYEIIVDNKMNTGDKISEFMNQLEKEDCFGAIILMTPAYKSKILDKDTSSGVYREFTKILSQKSKRSDSFTIFALHINGIIEKSIIGELTDYVWLDLTKIHFDKGEPILTKDADACIQNIDKLCKDVLTNAQFAKSEFLRYKEKLRADLLERPKANFNDPKNKELINTIIVRNPALDKVRKAEALILVGRKGSGKSTITQVVPLIYSDDFLIDTPVNANKLDLDNVYTNILARLDPEIASGKSDSRFLIYKFGWIYFIYLLYLDGLIFLCDGVRTVYTLETDEYKKIAYFLHTIKDTYTQSIKKRKIDKESYYDDFTKIFFTHALSKANDYLNEAGKKIRKDSAYTLSDWNALMTEEHFLSFCFDAEILKTIENASKLLAKGSKKYLFTLDNFDNIFYQQRKKFAREYSRYVQDSTNEYFLSGIRKLADNDCELLYALITLIFDHSGKAAIPILKNFIFCIAIPEDLFFEVKKLSRDSVTYIEKTLNWTGIQLVILLRKRLEILHEVKIEKLLHGEKIGEYNVLSELLAIYYKELPEYVSVKFNEQTYEVPLFVYILRHTFWRPREIILHFADLISYIETYKTRKERIGNKEIKASVKKISSEIIEKEFLSEFDTYCANIREIISVFRDSKQILSYTELQEKLHSVEFVFTSETSPKDATGLTIETFSFLYQIGFIGIILTEEKVESSLLHKYSFIFNAGNNLLKKLNSINNINVYDFIIHPIFYEYLGLDNTDNKEFVLNFSIEYLYWQDKHFGI